MTDQEAGFCPRCGTARVGTYRYCPNCAYDHAPVAEPPAVHQPFVRYAAQFPRPGSPVKPPRFASLQQKFISLGTLAGRPLAEIVAVAGPANSITVIAPGIRLLQWIKLGYHIALLFDDEDICGGVQSETAIR